ncbi:hypothetical protein MYCTH_2299979 [Thermothelomyces thermophilus ATCC 42464]|uniref:Uncharacterized protein n=1 Tax=Thermothelomyces thermophilus (strain ATCC 42464 / BCRC 31852 / DSM 1799) TaxID=573729 RepID=G2QA46_THET4|nr:uncharacterized protein MYCTH_2299979 [Thermothelomyces thermophilus ATCC 42464]AEO55794.1 hypothetical protein MYCTH_2299979 [Thermothelomyces thermophilus ATCC 42464]
MGNPLRQCQKWLQRNIWGSKGMQPESVAIKPRDPPSNDMSTKTQSHPTTEPPPYSQESRLTALPEYDVLFRPVRATRASTQAAVCVAGVTGGPAAARAVATVISIVSHSVANVSKDERPATVSAITTAVIKFATRVVQVGPGVPSVTIYDQALASVPVASMPALAEGLPKALSNIDHALSSVVPWLRDSVAATIAEAVAKVTDDVAAASLDGGTWRADMYSRLANSTADGVPDRGVASTRSGPQKLPEQLPDPDSSKSSSADTRSKYGSCEAVRRVARMQAVIYAIRAHAATAGHIQAERALAAVAAGSGLPDVANAVPGATKCTCNKSPLSCEASLQVVRARAALSAVKSYTEMTKNTEAAQALSAAERQTRI